MASKKTTWKKGRGKLGPLQPLLGNWEATADSPMGKLKCSRQFKNILNGKYTELIAKWEFKGGVYEERAIYGATDEGISFWSFTSDGKRSQGQIADGTDVHAEAICFEATMPAGIARMIYWPGEDGTIHWAVESKTKKGWNRFTQHHYHPVAEKK